MSWVRKEARWQVITFQARLGPGRWLRKRLCCHINLLNTMYQFDLDRVFERTDERVVQLIAHVPYQGHNSWCWIVYDNALYGGALNGRALRQQPYVVDTQTLDAFELFEEETYPSCITVAAAKFLSIQSGEPVTPRGGAARRLAAALARRKAAL